MNHGEHSGSKNTKVDAPTQCQVKQEAEMEEANGGEAGAMDLSAAAAAGRSGSNREEFITLSIAKSVLHCPLCTLPLKPPIFQCEVGHLACGACRAQLHSNSCLLCVDGGGGGGAYGRSPAIDAFVRGVKVPCPYSVYGCRSDVAYCDAGEHGRVCSCAPCGCPERGCPFQGAPPMLRGHLAAAHPRSGPVAAFRYGVDWGLAMGPATPWRAFFGQDDGSVFVASRGALGAGAAVTLVCVRANGGAPPAPQYTCKVAMDLPSAGGRDDDGMFGVIVSKVRSSALTDGAPSPDHGLFMGAYQELLAAGTVSLKIRRSRPSAPAARARAD